MTSINNFTFTIVGGFTPQKLKSAKKLGFFKRVLRVVLLPLLLYVILLNVSNVLMEEHFLRCTIIMQIQSTYIDSIFNKYYYMLSNRC